ncbi:MAG TPA: class I SAM-dependent methyltransferase [Actinospica sp.]|nr:class I SAM-dependent methyltransferase [Actinospica sp.]
MDLTEFDHLLTDGGRELLAELGALPAPADPLTAATRLRARFPAGLVTTALTQDRLRRRAQAKFGASAARMYFTETGYEQSTRAAVAALRAARYAAAGVRAVADLCCGIGGDALAFAAAGIRVLAVDRDPLTCAVARANAAALGLAELITVECADVTEVSPADCDAVFLDPARRGERGRVFDPGAYSPPWSFAVGLAENFSAAGFKVAPGIPHEAVPAPAEAEWVSDGGEVKEAGIYFGPLRGAERRATLLPGPHTLTAAGLADPESGEIGRYLYEPDGSVIRARLLGELAAALDAHTLDPTIAYLTADRLTPTPFATAYEVTDVLPFTVKKLRALVAERGYGTLAIKKRGADVDPEQLRRALRPSGPKANAATIIVTRHLGRHVALVAREPSTVTSS